MATALAVVFLGATSPMTPNDLVVSLVQHGPYRTGASLALDLELANPTDRPITATLHGSDVDIEGSKSGPVVAPIPCLVPNAALGPDVAISIPPLGRTTLAGAVDLACHARFAGSGNIAVRARLQLLFPVADGATPVRSEFETNSITIDLTDDADVDPPEPPGQTHCIAISGSTLPDLTLLPATACPARPNREAGRGTDTVAGFDRFGHVLFTSDRFAPVVLDHPKRDEFTLPITLDARAFASLHELRLSANGETTTVTSLATSSPTAIAQCAGNGKVLISWLGIVYPAIFVQTSEGVIESFQDDAAVASDTMTTNDRSLTIQFSDGVKSTTKTIPVLDCP